MMYLNKEQLLKVMKHDKWNPANRNMQELSLRIEHGDFDADSDGYILVYIDDYNNKTKSLANKDAEIRIRNEIIKKHCAKIAQQDQKIANLQKVPGWVDNIHEYEEPELLICPKNHSGLECSKCEHSKPHDHCNKILSFLCPECVPVKNPLNEKNIENENERRFNENTMIVDTLKTVTTYIENLKGISL